MIFEVPIHINKRKTNHSY